MYNDMAMTDVCKQIHENMFKKTNMHENAKNKYTWNILKSNMLKKMFKTNMHETC